MGVCVYVCVVVEGMYTCMNDNFGNTPLCVYVCVVAEGMYTCMTGNFGNKPLCVTFMLL